MVAVSQCGQCCDGFRVVHLPSTPAAFQACCARFAAGFGRSAAALPATLSELRVVDHLTTLQNIIDQAVRFSLLGSVPQRATLRQQLLPGGFVALVLECVQQVLRPRAALVRVGTEHDPSAVVHVFGEVVEVQPQPVQR